MTVGTSLVIAGLLAACGPEAVPSIPPTPTVEPLPTPITTEYALAAVAWYAGLIVHVDGALSVIDGGGGSVAVDLRLENPGPELASLEAPLMLVSGKQAVDPVRETVLPDIPPASTVRTTVIFNVAGSFNVQGSAVRIGRAGEHEVVVPIVAGGEGLLVLQPRPLSVRGTTQAGALRVVVSAGELRADLPDWGLELPLESMALTLTYSATFRSDFAGGFPFTSSNIGLKLPDGRTIAASDDGHSAPAQVLAPGVKVDGLQSRFVVPAPGTGSYVLLVRSGSSIAKIPFKVVGP
jgi:hypothetical protein